MPLLIYIFLQNNFRLNFWLILTFTWTPILRLILHDLYIFLVNEPNFKRFLELRPLDRRQDFALNLLGARGNRAPTPSPLFFAKFIWYDLKVFSKETILSTFLWQNINWYNSNNIFLFKKTYNVLEICLPISLPPNTHIVTCLLKAAPQGYEKVFCHSSIILNTTYRMRYISLYFL